MIRPVGWLKRVLCLSLDTALPSRACRIGRAAEGCFHCVTVKGVALVGSKRTHDSHFIILIATSQARYSEFLLTI